MVILRFCVKHRMTQFGVRDDADMTSNTLHLAKKLVDT